MDILLNDENDIAFDNADVPLVTDEERLDVAQRLRIKLQTFLGEWFLNIENGIPYYQRVYRKGVRKSEIDLLFQAAILEEPDVLAITEFNSTLDNASRHYSMNFRVRVASGETDTILIEA